MLAMSKMEFKRFIQTARYNDSMESDDPNFIDESDVFHQTHQVNENIDLSHSNDYIKSIYAIKLPLIKGDDYPMTLFNILSKYMQELASEHKEWPDVLTFTGHLGKEMIDFINKQGWDFSKFKMIYENSSIDKLIISYSKKLIQKSGNSAPISDGLDGKTMEGIPSNKDVQKMTSYVIGGIGYTLEREIEPKLEIKLTR